MRNDPHRIIFWIMSVNIGMYLISLLLIPRLTQFSWNPLRFLSPQFESLILLGGTGTVPIDKNHWWWTLLSANYLHGSILHIIFNMFALKQLAPLIIQLFGPFRMVAIYTLGGIAGFTISYLAGVQFTIGASAALCSLIGATLYYGKSRGGAFGQAVFKQVVTWIISLFVFGFVFPGIDNWGHGGGIIAGLFLGFLFGYHEKSPESVKHKIIAGACALATLLTLAWTLFLGIQYRLLA
jgi:rhomboid protease GluP